jgi:hypothetical protein
MIRRLAQGVQVAAATAVVTLASLAAAAPAPAARAATLAGASPATATQIPPPVYHGTLRVSGTPRDGAAVTAAGLSWHAPRLPRGMTLLSFEVAYSWQSCDLGGRHCRTRGRSATWTWPGRTTAPTPPRKARP